MTHDPSTCKDASRCGHTVDERDWNPPVGYAITMCIIGYLGALGLIATIAYAALKGAP